MQSRANCRSKVYHLFWVYLPVICLSALIITVYCAYVFTYLTILINVGAGLKGGANNKSMSSNSANSNSQADTNMNYAFNHTSSIESAHSKGMSLFIIVTICLVMLFISFIRTVFSNPGYFPSPLELEYKIILKNTKFNPEESKMSKPILLISL